MRLFVRALLICVSCVVCLIATLALWFFFYHRDLPDVHDLSKFAPNQPTQVADPCLGTSSYVAISYDAMGDHLRAALRAIGASEQGPTTLSSAYRGFMEGRVTGQSPLSSRISLTMFCKPSRILRRELGEFRVAVWLDRHFSRQELFAIYANRLWFAKDVVGVEAASQYFFGKDPNQLKVEEAALLAGMVRAPGRFSPINYPDRALDRRNQVLDAMVAANAIKAEEGLAAKASELKILQRAGQQTIQPVKQ
jgi:penicillin-binding protein 1A